LAVNDGGGLARVSFGQFAAFYEHTVGAVRCVVMVSQVKLFCTVLRGGRSFGIARHWKPVLKMYINPLTISRDDSPFAAAPYSRRNQKLE
jgi:hypothetical protein